MPIWAYVGRTPTRAVDTPMTVMVKQERELAADDVADAAEDRGAEGPNREPGSERCERGEQRGSVVAGREELRREERGEDAIEVEVVPLDDGARRRGTDHEGQLVVVATLGGGKGSCSCHDQILLWAHEVSSGLGAQLHYAATCAAFGLSAS